MAFKRESDVVVVGAGPVGLVTALSLKAAGCDVRVFDAGRRTAVHSYALVLHPSTLDLLDRVGLGAACIDAGRVVKRITLFEGTSRREDLDFSRLPGPYPYLVVLPQSRLESILVSALSKRGLEVEWDHRVQGLEPETDKVQLSVARLDKVSTGYPVAHTEVVVDKLHDHTTRYVVGADGYDSFVRRRLGIAFEAQGSPHIYSVFQFATGGDVPAEGRLTIEGERVGGYWPLPDGHCRFSFPVAAAEEHGTGPGRLSELLAARAPWFRGNVGGIDWSAVGLFESKLAASFGEGRVWMAGDAAHLTSPLGAQSMNVGLREGADLADRLLRVLRSPGDADLLAEYGAARAAEWRTLVGPQAGYGTRRALLRPCIPASGADLETMLGQLT
jgi:2-polyprenyl-6-methoxyphenol hydroxylase-like FAD-dependent oxidoreductase